MLRDVRTALPQLFPGLTSVSRKVCSVAGASGQGSYNMPFYRCISINWWSNNPCNSLILNDLEARLAQQLSYHSQLPSFQ